MVIVDIRDLEHSKFMSIVEHIIREAVNAGCSDDVDERHRWIRSHYGVSLDSDFNICFDDDRQALYFMIKFGLLLTS